VGEGGGREEWENIHHAMRFGKKPRENRITDEQGVSGFCLITILLLTFARTIYY